MAERIVVIRIMGINIMDTVLATHITGMVGCIIIGTAMVVPAVAAMSIVTGTDMDMLVVGVVNPMGLADAAANADVLPLVGAAAAMAVETTSTGVSAKRCTANISQQLAIL